VLRSNSIEKEEECKLMEKALKFFHEYGVENITLKIHESKKTPFVPS
jgi:hypothetical protein